MPLITSSRPIDTSNMNLIRFGMHDAGTLMLVGCGVTLLALEDLRAREGTATLSVEEVFAEYRERIEAAASAKYDAGKREPNGDVLVKSSDL